MRQDDRTLQDYLTLKGEYLDWLVDPARQGSQANWCETHSVAVKTVQKWKRDPEFRRELDHKLAALNVDSLRIQKVIDAMWAKASEGDVKAADLYLKFTERLRPTRPSLEDDADVSSMSDEDLYRALNEAAQTLTRAHG